MAVETTQTRPSQTAVLPRIGLAAGILLLLLFAYRSFVYTPDDAFITYRFSRNFIEGQGAIFNPGAPERVEGYSCPLYMILIALLMKLPLGVEILFRAKFLGIGFGVAALVVTQKLSRRVGLPLWAQAAIPALLATHAGFSISSIDGMETILAELLMTLGAYLFIQERSDPDPIEANAPEQRRNAGFPFSGLVFAACALTRPEGLLMGLMALGVALWMQFRHQKRLDLRWLAAFLIPVVAWFLFRRFYYGVWMPNTYFAKNVPLGEALSKGSAYLLRTFFLQLNESLVLFALGAGWWFLAGIGVYREAMRRTPNVIIPLMVIGQVVFAVRAGGDWMGGWRYMAAAVPLLMLLSVAGIVEISDNIRKEMKQGGAMVGGSVAGVLTAALLAVCLYGQTTFWGRPDSNQDGYLSWGEKRFTLNQRELLQGWLLHKTLDIADWLNKNAPPGSTVAYSEMGVTPFLCPTIRFLDVDGLTDHGVATLPGAKHEQIGVRDDYISMSGVVGPYLRNVRKPDFIIRGSGVEKGAAAPEPPVILDDAYDPMTAFPMHSHIPTQDSYMLVWKRRQ